MKKTGLHSYVYDFNVDYDATDVDDILDIHKYLMKKNDSIIKCLSLLKKSIFCRINDLLSFMSINFLSCISMNNQECKVRLQIVNVNSNEPVFYPFSIETSKCSGSCNNIIDP